MHLPKGDNKKLTLAFQVFSFNGANSNPCAAMLPFQAPSLLDDRGLSCRLEGGGPRVQADGADRQNDGPP